MISLSVIIPTHQRRASLLRLLDSLAQQTLATDRFEILVVANFPDWRLTRALRDSRATLPSVRELSPSATGANASRNLGIRAARGEILLLLDDDCLVTSSLYFERVLELHQDHPAALAIGGTYSVPERSRAEDVAYNLISREWQLEGTEGVRVTTRLIGGNVSYKRAMLEKTGQSYNQSIFYGGAELEFHGRLAAQGAELLLVPDLTVHHDPRIGRRDLVKKAFKQALTAVQFAIPQEENKGARHSFQAPRYAQAVKHAANAAARQELCELMEYYDRAYNLVVKERISSLAKLRFRLWRGARVPTQNPARGSP